LSILALVLFVLGGEGSIAFSTDGSSIQTSFHQLALYLLDDSGHYWMTAAGVFLLGLFPALLLLVLALVLLGSRYNFKYILLGGLGASVVGFGILIITLTQTQRGFWSEARTQSELVIPSNNFDTLSIGLNKVENIWYDAENDFVFNINEQEAQLGQIEFDIKRSPNDSIYLQIIRRAKGSNLEEAKQRATSIDYSFDLENQQLSFNPYFSIYRSDKWRKQELEIKLLLPDSQSVYLEKGMERIIWDIENKSNTLDQEMPLHIWTMTEEGLECADC